MDKIIEPYVMDRQFTVVGLLDTFSSFIWTDRYDKAGDFELVMPVSVENIALFQNDYLVLRTDSEHLMYVDTIETQSNVESGSVLKVTGHSMENILNRRIIWKQTRIQGNLQNGIEKLLNENLISPEDSSRKMEGFKFVRSTDPNVTSLSVDAQFTGDSLYDAVTKIVKDANLGFKVTMPTDGQFEFRLYSGVDRTYDQTDRPYIIFSPNFENLMNSNSIVTYVNHRTVALVGGEGEGSDRYLTTVEWDGGAGTGFSRREVFIDARDVSRKVNNQEVSNSEYYKMLKTRGKEHLAEYKITTTFDGEAENSRSFKYGKDFNIGDIVQLEDEYGQTFTARITEYIYSCKGGSINEYPTFSIINEGGN